MDNIVNYLVCEEPQYGFINLNEKDSLCNPKEFSVNGTYSPPFRSDFVSAQLLFEQNGNPVSYNTNAVTMQNFSNGDFESEIQDITQLGLTDGYYEISVEATFMASNGFIYTLYDTSTNINQDLYIGNIDILETTFINSSINNTEVLLSWDDTGSTYTIQFTSDGYCCLGREIPIDQVIHELETNVNYISEEFFEQTLAIVSGSKYLRIRVKSTCSEWSKWCCMSSYTWSENNFFNGENYNNFYNCLNEIDLENLIPPSPFMQPIIVYPNPTNGNVTLSNITGTELTFYDINQNKIMKKSVKNQKNEVNIDLSNLKNGIYIIKTNADETFKIIKE